MLSHRERSVLWALAKGLPYIEIARTQFISLRTVERTIEELKDKLMVSTLFCLGREAERLRLLSAGPEHDMEIPNGGLDLPRTQ